MEFNIINMEHWSRKEYYDHYFSAIPCTYSMTTKLNITVLKKNGIKLYPAMLYALSVIVNRHDEFRTALNEKGEVGIFSEMMPCYTVFHKDSETFSNIWTKYSPDYNEFFADYQQDLKEYGHVSGIEGKPHTPPNTFPVSMIPWTSFEGFNLNLQKGYGYLLPIFTMGKYYTENSKYWMSLAIQVHHAVCDGFHLCRFINELQGLIMDFEQII